MDKGRVILHCDMNAFYASVELLAYPELAAVPVAVCGDPGSRHGIILAKNEPAKKFGIVTAETVYAAKRKCPELILLPAHHEKYAAYSKKINEIYYRFTDLVEPFSVDESWLDVTASRTLFGSGEEMAHKIKDTVKAELGLTQSVGVSFNKVFAKMGSDYKKPDAVTVISRENYRELLWPLDVGELFTCGRATAEKLRQLSIRTIGDLACADQRMLARLFGKAGESLYAFANGLEDSPVRPAGQAREIKSVGNGITFKRDLVGEADILTGITSLVDTVSARLRRYGLKCEGVKVDIKDPDFKTISRQMRLPAPTNLSEDLKAGAMALIRANWSMNAPIRLITITAISLVPGDAGTQLSLFDLPAEEGESRAEKAERLAKTMDEIRERYGKSSIAPGRIVGSDIGLPDE
jgi:DNA polymerase-4